MWYIHTMWNYLTIKKNEVLIQVTTWMSLKIIMLSERSQIQNARCIIPLIINSRKGKIMVMESSSVVARSLKIDYKRAWGNFLKWWKCSVSWLWWWSHYCVKFSKAHQINLRISVHRFYLILPLFWNVRYPR